MNTIYLTKHFTLSEMCLSGTAISHGLENKPDEQAVANLKLLCVNVLEPLRCRFGVIRITSGFRTREVNALVGGVKSSQHLFGQAADIFVPNAEIGRKMYEFLLKQVDFDQLIYEFSVRTQRHWIHVSYNEGHNRHQFFMNYDITKTSAHAKRELKN